VHHPSSQNIEILAVIVLTALVTLKMTYKKIPYYIRNRYGIYHFIHGIPADLRSHYRSDRICLSLRTKSEPKAFQAAGSISRSLGSGVYKYFLLLKHQWKLLQACQHKRPLIIHLD